MWKRSLCLVAFLAIVLTASGCGAGPGDAGHGDVQARLNEEFSLSMGQRALIAGEDLGIRFEEVTEDSRCPRGVTCIWAGRVTCVVEITQASASYRMAVIEPGLSDEYSRESYGGYELAFHVTPYPEAGKKIAKDTYRLHLIISKVPELAEIIGSIIAEPVAFAGQDITIVGYYCGWDSLQEAKTAPRSPAATGWSRN